MARRPALLALLAALAVAGAAAPPAHAAPGTAASPAQTFAGRVLALHNAERLRMGMQPLRWDERLAAQARRWAVSLARAATLQHAADTDDGENLWMGTASRYSPDEMIGDFLAERSAFRPGRFPRVSRTGNWQDVGHYTQIIWPGTRAVGCAAVRGGGNDVLVCRYWPAGNVIGETLP